MKKIFVVSDYSEASLLVELLAAHGISSYSYAEEDNTYFQILTGMKNYGTSILVREEDYKEAKELVDAYRAEQSPRKSKKTEEDFHIPFYKNKRFLAWMIIGWFAFLFLLFTILEHL